MKTHFLLAEWNNLILANYAVPKALLLPYVPANTSLDLFGDEAFVSLAGFMFLNTRMMGLSVPRYTGFEEISLRFYVKHNDHGTWKRGVSFIRQVVPHYAVSFIANHVFRENYETKKMTHFYTDKGDLFEAGYEWKNKSGWNRLAAMAPKRSVPLAQGSLEEFTSARSWGYTRYRAARTYEYEVERQPWEIHRATEYEVRCDFAALAGKAFAFLNASAPRSVFIIKGAEVRVLHRRLVS